MKIPSFLRRRGAESEAQTSTRAPAPESNLRGRQAGHRAQPASYATSRYAARPGRSPQRLPAVPTERPLPAFARRAATVVHPSPRGRAATAHGDAVRQDAVRLVAAPTRSATGPRPVSPRTSPALPSIALLRPTFALRGSDSRDFALDLEQLFSLRPQVNGSVFVSAAEATEMACSISLASYAELLHPVALRSHGVLHLFEYADFMRHWRERGTNPCTRQQVQHSELLYVRVAEGLCQKN